MSRLVQSYIACSVVSVVLLAVGIFLVWSAVHPRVYLWVFLGAIGAAIVSSGIFVAWMIHVDNRRKAASRMVAFHVHNSI